MGKWVRDFVNVCASRHPAWMEWRIEEAILRNAKKLMKEHNVPGLQVAFCVHGRAVREIVLGEARRGKTLTREHRFRVCSLSKPVSAVVALTLVRDSVLGLDESLAREIVEVVPELSVVASGKRAITLRDLLCHTSGFDTVHSPRVPANQRHWTLRDVLDARIGEAWKGRRVGEVGTIQRYSGINSWLLQYVLERRCGKSMQEIAKAQLFEPLGLQSAEYEVGGLMPEGLATGHDESGKERPAEWAPGGAASGLVCRARDLLEFAMVSFPGSTLLPEELRRGMCESRADARAWTLGWHAYKDVDERSLGHGGSGIGFRGMTVLVPGARTAVVAITNSEGGDRVIRSLTGLMRELALRSVGESVEVRGGSVGSVQH